MRSNWPPSVGLYATSFLSIVSISTLGAYASGIVMPFADLPDGVLFVVFCAIAAILTLSGDLRHTRLAASASVSSIFPTLLMLVTLLLYAGSEDFGAISVTAELCGSAGKISIFNIAFAFGLCGVAGAAWSVLLSRICRRFRVTANPVGAVRDNSGLGETVFKYAYWSLAALALSNYVMALLVGKEILTVVCRSILVDR